MLPQAIGDAFANAKKLPQASKQRSATFWVVHLFPAAGKATSKVGEHDDTVAIDSGRLRWATPLFEAIAKREGNEKLWPEGYPAFAHLIKEAARKIHVDVVAYQMRHSGASLDRAHHIRSLDAIQKRGRWMSAKSCRRYEKMGRLNETWGSLQADVQKQFLAASNNIDKVFLRGKVLNLRTSIQGDSMQCVPLKL